MSNVYRVNITCPRCRFVGDIEQDFPCGHQAEIDRLGSAIREAIAILGKEISNGTDWIGVDGDPNHALAILRDSLRPVEPPPKRKAPKSRRTAPKHQRSK